MLGDGKFVDLGQIYVDPLVVVPAIGFSAKVCVL
jgi:hypothetical protein